MSHELSIALETIKRKPYKKPELKKFGSLQQLTKGLFGQKGIITPLLGNS